MLLERERRCVVRFARRLVPDGLVVGTAGNISARDGTLIAITPTSIAYGDLEPAAIAVVNGMGFLLDGKYAPSSELPMHLAAYRATEAGAVVHTHSPFATALAIAGVELPPVHYLAAQLGGTVRVAPYATFGSIELAEGVADALAGRSAALLERHGAIVVGRTVEEAYERALYLEWLAAAYVRALALAPPAALDPSELQRISSKITSLTRHAVRTRPVAADRSPAGGMR